MFDLHKIWTYLKRDFSLRDVFLLGALKILYIVTRIYNLTLLPIFTDEGIYIRWAKVAWHDASWRFISLTDGKQPLQTWGTIPFLKLFPNDALFAGRLFSVATGLFALTGLFLLLYRFLGKRTAYIGSLLYIFSPYFLFYDRMALADSAVNAFFIWIVFLSLLLVQTIRLDVALLFGIVAGFGLLTKSSVQMFLGMSFLTSLFVFDYKKRKLSGFLSYMLMFALSFFIAQVIYNVQRLSPFMHYVSQKNGTFVMTFGEWIRDPFAVVFSNLKTVPYYVFAESGWIVVPFAVVALYFMFRKSKPAFWYILAWIVIPYLGISFMTRVLFPRYIIFFGSILTILAAYALGTIANAKMRVALVGLIVSSLIVFQFPMWTDYSKIKFPETDRGQYIGGATVGIGVKEIIDFARTKSQDKPVVLLAEGNFGLVGDMLDTYLRPTDTNIEIRGYWPLTLADLQKNQKDLQDKYVYVVTSHQAEVPMGWPTRLIKSFYKPDHQSAIHLLELTQ
jgi:4-amino-4-deoxy-L-arabinose transferase-like glycosyltransferase